MLRGAKESEQTAEIKTNNIKELVRELLMRELLNKTTFHLPTLPQVFFHLFIYPPIPLRPQQGVHPNSGHDICCSHGPGPNNSLWRKTGQSLFQ